MTFTELCDETFFIKESAVNQLKYTDFMEGALDIYDNVEDFYESESSNIFVKIKDAIIAIAKKVSAFIKELLNKFVSIFKPNAENIKKTIKIHPELGEIEIETDKIEDVVALIKARDDVRKALIKEIKRGKKITAEDVDIALKKCNKRRVVRRVVVSISIVLTIAAVALGSGFFKERDKQVNTATADLIESADDDPEVIAAAEAIIKSYAEDSAYATEKERNTLSAIRDVINRALNDMRNTSDILSDDATIDALVQWEQRTNPNYTRGDFVNDAKRDLNRAHRGLKTNINKYRDTLDTINSYDDR